MNQKTAQLKKPAKKSRDEHELLQQDPRRMSSSPQVPSKRNSERDDFRWLNEVRDVLSPYWSSRVENHPEKTGPVLVLENARPQNR